MTGPVLGGMRRQALSKGGEKTISKDEKGMPQGRECASMHHLHWVFLEDEERAGLKGP